ncbi:hypothetical protein HAX54_041331, partial [Datura stramonium]|nr:hypothetical protein [Datura stramonium]
SHMGSSCSIHKNRPSMLRETRLMRVTFHLSSLPSATLFHNLGLGYVFAKLEDCNLTLVREFYADWDTSFGESTKIKIRGQVVCFNARSFNALLGMLVV